MKIIAIDNFDRETRSDRVVAEKVLSYYAEEIAKFLNGKFGGENSDDFFKAVSDDYKIYKFEP